MIDALHADLPARPPADPDRDADARVFAMALFEAGTGGLLPLDDLDALASLTAPVRVDGPASAAASIAYLLAYAVAPSAPAAAVEWLEDCARRFPDETYASLERAGLLATLTFRLGRVDDALATVEAGLAAAARHAPLPHDSLARLHATRATIRFDLGLYDVAEDDLDAAERHAEAAETPDARYDLLTTRLDHDLGIGRFEAVVRRTEDRARFGSDRAQVLAVYRAAALRFLEHVRPGSEDEAAGLLRTALDSGALPADLWVTAAQKWVALSLDRGLRQDAEQGLANLAALAPVDPERFAADIADLVDFDTVALATRAALAAGDRDALVAQLPLHRAAFEALLRRWDGLESRAAGVGRLHLDRWRRVVGEYARLRLAVEPGAAGRRAALDALLAVHARSTLARALGAPRPDADALCAALPEAHGMLVFLPIDHTTLVVAFDRDRIVAVEGVAAGTLLVAARDFERVLDRGRNTDARFEELSRTLADALFPPAIADRLAEWRSVTVTGTELLGGATIEALAVPGLPTDDDRAATVGERLAIDHAPSAGAWLALAARPYGTDAPALWATLQPAAGVADVEARSVPRAFVAAWQAIWPEPSARVRIDTEATVASLLSADLRGVRCLHILAHGVWEDHREVAALLALHPDRAHPRGLLTPQAVASLRAVPATVLLSACGAGTSHPRRGDGFQATLAGSMLRAGARAVVVGNRDLFFEPHAEIAQVFLGGLANGAPPAEAMRRARAAVTGGRSSPAALRVAALRVVGNGQ